MIIESIDAFQIFDSRGNPTVEVEVTLEKWHQRIRSGRLPAPRPGNTRPWSFATGQAGSGHVGVQKAVSNICTEIAPALKGKDACDEEGIDRCMIELDGDRQKPAGANADLGVSMAAAKAAAVAEGKALFDYRAKAEGYLLPLPEIRFSVVAAHMPTGESMCRIFF